MIIAIPIETFPGERRVALTPAGGAGLVKDGHEVRVEQDAGTAAGFSNAEYEARGARVWEDRRQLIADADVVLQVRTLGTNPDSGRGDLDAFRSGQVVIGHADPLMAGDAIRALCERGVTLLAIELMPRITRAQTMDALSSQANLAGYKAVIRAADTIGRIFPMMMTAAGTIQPARVFVIGAGVAGLQAIATAKRLGAVVSAFDVRPAVREQVESLGARFVQLPLDTAAAAEDKGGYAKEQSEEQLRKQQELMASAVAEANVVITTALVPGKRAPVLVTQAMVEGMTPGSVIIDLAAEKGGNCELTRPGETVEHHGVTIIGDDNPTAGVAHDASQMYANNLVRFLKHLTGKGATIEINSADEITAGTLVCRDGQIVHPRVKEMMGK